MPALLVTRQRMYIQLCGEDQQQTLNNMIKMFAAKMAGGVNDPDDLVVGAFKAFDEEVEEKIKGQMVKRHIMEKENFIHILTAFGDKLNEDEIDDIFGEFEYDDNGDVLTKTVVDLFVPGAMDEKKEEEEEKKEEAPAEEAAAPEEGAKKKEKKEEAPAEEAAAPEEG